MSTKAKMIIVAFALVALIGVLVITAPGPSDNPNSASGKTSSDIITIGGKNFTEQVILGEILAQTIEAHTGLGVSRKLNLGGTMICFNAIQSGDLDAYAEYTGTGLVNILDKPVMSDPEKTYNTVKKDFADKYQLVWLKPFGFNNTYTLTMRRKQAESMGIESISDLAEYIKNNPDKAPTAAFDGEFHARPDGYKGLKKHYGFEFPEKPKQMDAGLMYRACADSAVDVICAFATDGRIPAYDLKVLKDDKNFFPPYYAAPLVRKASLDKHPELEEALNLLAGKIDDHTMQKLNYEVDEKKPQSGGGGTRIHCGPI